MLELYTSGYGYSQRRCEDAVTFFISKYLPRHHITLEVLHRGLKREYAIGFCEISGRTYKPREFLIQLQSRMESDRYLTTLFHELWHVYQYVKGDLKLKSCKKYYKGICMEHLEYKDHPWEIEAYKKEKELYKEYIRYLNA